MKITFSKYQGTGNDFIMLNNLNGEYSSLNIQSIKFLCDRKLGIGADGLILICPSESEMFKVDYYNSDGTQSFCGNGARCSVIFAKSIGLVEGRTSFEAIDGKHIAEILNDGTVKLEMLPVNNISTDGLAVVMDTGSPHYILFEDIKHSDIVELGRTVRFSEKYKTEGINVNSLIELGPNAIDVETYERGVEDETLSCGTGVTACALAYMDKKGTNDKITVKTKGGELAVVAEKKDGGFDNIWLIGPAKKVFDGSVDI